MSSKGEYTKLWRARNKEQFKSTEKSYYNNNKDSILKVKAKYERKRKAIDINYKLKKNLRSRLSTAVKIKSGSAVKDLGCTIQELREYLESKFSSEMTWFNWGIGNGCWQIDHIKPLCHFNLNNSDELKQACHYTNLQPIWYEDHLVKTRIDTCEV